MLFGGALAATVLLSIAAVSRSDATTVRVLQDPHPAYVVRITEGTPYTVPPGTMLSVKSIGQSGEIGAGGQSCRLLVNGTDALVVQTSPNPIDLSMPVVASSGDVVELLSLFGPHPSIKVVALGYLTRL